MKRLNNGISFVKFEKETERVLRNKKFPSPEEISVKLAALRESRLPQFELAFRLKMEIEKSRNGFYTVTFFNKKHMNESDILKEFNTVGNVIKIIENYQRVFIRFKEKEEAERAIKKFGEVYDVSMAKNNKIGENQHSEGGTSHSHNHRHSPNHAVLPAPDISDLSGNMDKLNSNNKLFHLILGNLPKNYTAKDVNDLVAEASPVSISQLDETKVFNIKFCHIVLDSAENLRYLIDKLNGFVICGEKLIAAEAKCLLEWKEKRV